MPIKEDVGAAAVVGQALGFRPSDVALATEGRSAIYQADQRLKDRRTALVRHYAMAMTAGDVEAAAEVREDIKAFNDKNPDRRITGQNLVQSVQRRRQRAQEAEGGVYLPKNRRDAARAGEFATTE